MKNQNNMEDQDELSKKYWRDLNNTPPPQNFYRGGYNPHVLMNTDNREEYNPFKTDLQSFVIDRDQWFMWLKARMPDVHRIWINQALEGHAEFRNKSSEARIKELEQQNKSWIDELAKEMVKRKELEEENKRLEGKIKELFWKEGNGVFYSVEKQNRWEQWCKELGIKP